MGLAQLDIYERYTYAAILCLHTWVFRVLLPLYFNSKGQVVVEIAMGIGQILVLSIPRIRRFRTFLGGDFGQFPTDFTEFVGTTGPDSEKKCCHGPN